MNAVAVFAILFVGSISISAPLQGRTIAKQRMGWFFCIFVFPPITWADIILTFSHRTGRSVRRAFWLFAFFVGTFVWLGAIENISTSNRLGKFPLLGLAVLLFPTTSILISGFYFRSVARTEATPAGSRD
jgi:hypothetical protein